MISAALQLQSDYIRKMKGLIFFRALFALLLFTSSVIYGFQNFQFTPILSIIIVLSICIFLLVASVVYYIIFRFTPDAVWFAYLQFVIDSVMITLIVFVTGSFISFFTFLYLIVIICASMFLLKKGGIVIALICCLQYSALILLEFRGILPPINVESGFAATDFATDQILFKILATVVACYAVAYLSSILAVQERDTKRELLELEYHVRRVEKNAAIGEMAAGLAHEIKNPLASLSGSIQMLKNEIHYDPQHDKLMRIVLREADRLSRLVSDFLLFARPSIGVSTCFHLNTFVAETVELFQKDRTWQGEIEYTDTTDAPCYVEMDPGHLKQVLWNLFLNAVHAVSVDGKISIRLFSQQKTFACIAVEDNGCGISEKTLKSIFDPFFTTRSEGTGLGLSIVQRILAAYDSRIDVESREGVGTTFTLKLKQVAPPEAVGT